MGIKGIAFWRISAVAVIAVMVLLSFLAWQMMQSLWGVPDHRLIDYFLALLYWLSYLMVPIICCCLWALRRKKGGVRVAAALVLLPTILLFWGRFIEPNLLTVERHVMPAPFDLKVAFIADIHVGMYSTTWQMERLVDQLNTLDIDEVWVAGDWTHLPPFDMQAAFSALQRLKHPVYSVPGNHDAERPGPPVQSALRQVLKDLGVAYLENQSVQRSGFRLLGLGSAWALESHYQLASNAAQDTPVIVLAHNPDVANFLPNSVFLVLAGHTHGGQVDLPWITQRVLDEITMAGVDEGWYKTPNGPMFVTRGIGMVGLPVRFGNLPVVDVIEFSAEAIMPRLQDAMAPKGRFRGW